MTKETIAEMEVIHKECRELGIKKNSDYGEQIDSIQIVGLLGLSTRLIDKACRIFSLVQPRNVQRVLDETLEDTLKDIINYATYGICIIRKKWSNKEREKIVDDWSDIEEEESEDEDYDKEYSRYKKKKEADEKLRGIKKEHDIIDEDYKPVKNIYKTLEERENEEK